MKRKFYKKKEVNMSELQIFKNPEFGQVRMTEINGKPYFFGVDVATALEYARPSKAVSDHCKGVLTQDTFKNSGGYPEKLIPEGDVYRLIVKASEQSTNPNIKEKAERFASWIFDEILPSIRQTGGYITPQAQMLQFLQGMLDEMKRQAAELNEVKEQSSKALETTQNIKDALINTYDNWRDWVKQNVSAIQKGSNMSYQDVYSRMYEELERRAKCRLSIRVDNQRKRMAMAGASKTAVDNYRSIDAIEDDARLKEIFTAIVKEYAVKYVA